MTDIPLTWRQWWRGVFGALGHVTLGGAVRAAGRWRGRRATARSRELAEALRARGVDAVVKGGPVVACVGAARVTAALAWYRCWCAQCGGRVRLMWWWDRDGSSGLCHAGDVREAAGKIAADLEVAAEGDGGGG